MLMHPQSRASQLVEFGATSQIFTHPKDKRLRIVRPAASASFCCTRK
jgi:hypothetical protein